MHYLFADEAGDFHFAKNRSASTYFILCTVQIPDCNIGEKVLSLRRQLAWNKLLIEGPFHCSEDKEPVREAMFQLLAGEKFRIDATILEKSKAEPRIRQQEYFYKHAWFYHFKHIAPTFLKRNDELHVYAASLGEKKKRMSFKEAINDVVQQITRDISWVVSFWSAESDPCLQVADYCAWAIQRKWERGDSRRYDMIKHNIKTEFDLFKPGTTHYY
jgi:Protein of unknown function (DUF3800)